MAKQWPIISAFLLIGITAQSQKIFFEQLTTAEGLPSDYVNCVFEDSKGYLWIGTDKGACRYDGREFLYFSNDNGLSSNFISCFAEDPAGNIWIGTVDAGISLFDGKKIKIFPIPSHQNANIREISFLTDGSFFIAAERHDLLYFDSIAANPRRFHQFSFIKKIEENLFLSGLYGQLCLFEKKGHQLLQYPHPEPSDKYDYFAWLSDQSMVVFNENLLQNFVIENKKWVKKNDFVLDIDFPSKPAWLDLKKVLVNKEELFVATPKGLLHIDKNKTQSYFTSENGLGTSYIKSLFRNKQGVIYICTYGAGIKIWPTGYLSEIKTPGKVTSIFPTADQTYITTTNAVYQYNIPERKISELKVLLTGNYTSLYKTKNEMIYLGTLNSFYRFPASWFDKNEVTDNTARHALSINTGTSGFAAQGNKMFISTYGEGIYLFNPELKKYDTLDKETIQATPLIVESLVSLGESVAALTYNSGLSIYDSINRKINLTRHDGLLSNTVYSVFKESDNRIWIGTKGGLNLFNGKHIIKTFSSKEGLTGTNVVCIFKDNVNRLWVLSDKFLHLLDGEILRTVRSHKLLYGEKQSINRAVFCRDNNILYIGLTDAMLTVDISKVILDTIVTVPKLAAIVKDSMEITIGMNKPLSISNPAAKIFFRFEHPTHSLNQQFDIYYKLTGFDDDWKLLSNTNVAFYQKLSAGKYELIAKTINLDGYSSPDFSLLSFEVLPPLWKRNWFIVIMSVVLLAICFFIGNVLSKRRYKQKLRHLQEEFRLQLERERIARELHDNVGSQLTYLINKIDDDYSKLSEKNEAEKLSSVARGAMQELRETIWALDKKEVPWDELQNKIRELIRLYKKENHTVELEWKVNDLPPLNPLEALNIYRIIQEALNNSEKYSNASIIGVIVSNQNEGIIVEIKDNGKGFDVQQTEKGYGLKNMKKRAEEMNALLQIESANDVGTSVKLYLT